MSHVSDLHLKQPSEVKMIKLIIHINQSGFSLGLRVAGWRRQTLEHKMLKGRRVTMAKLFHLTMCLNSLLNSYCILIFKGVVVELHNGWMNG